MRDADTYWNCMCTMRISAVISYGCFGLLLLFFSILKHINLLDTSWYSCFPCRPLVDITWTHPLLFFFHSWWKQCFGETNMHDSWLFTTYRLCVCVYERVSGWKNVCNSVWIIPNSVLDAFCCDVDFFCYISALAFYWVILTPADLYTNYPICAFHLYCVLHVARTHTHTQAIFLSVSECIRHIRWTETMWAWYRPSPSMLMDRGLYFTLVDLNFVKCTVYYTGSFILRMRQKAREKRTHNNYGNVLYVYICDGISTYLFMEHERNKEILLKNRNNKYSTWKTAHTREAKFKTKTNGINDLWLAKFVLLSILALVLWGTTGDDAIVLIWFLLLLVCVD